MRTAFLIDGGFFLARYHRLAGTQTPRQAVAHLIWMCREHLRRENRDKRQLYRVFYYDCPPLAKKVHHPLTRRCIDFATTPLALWRNEFLATLRRQRKVALRYGYLNERSGYWTLKPEPLKRLLAGQCVLNDLAEADFRYDVQQKGVDMRIGLDIASLATKKLVDQIVLVAGDSDFVPAAKMARREGIDFILDPLWASIKDDLHEHIDGLVTVFRRRTPNERPT